MVCQNVYSNFTRKLSKSMKGSLGATIGVTAMLLESRVILISDLTHPYKIGW